MKILVTGSSGHLGEALVRSLRSDGFDVAGLDVKPSEFTTEVGSITDANFVGQTVAGCDSIIHTATLHKPHIGTHTRQDFIDTNISGTLNLLEAAVESGCRSFIYTSTTSTFGDAMKPESGEPAVWVTEALQPKPKNIYGVTKAAAEDLSQLFHRNTGLPCVVLKTSRFFPEQDDSKDQRDAFDDTNLKVNELLHRRIDIADIVAAHRLAVVHAEKIGFDKLILTATTPFSRDDAAELAIDLPAVLSRYVPDYQEVYERRGWNMYRSIGRVYDNTRARTVLDWEPSYSFAKAVERLCRGEDYRSVLAQQVGSKGYHSEIFREGPYPVGNF
ncbi:MAG: NAD(P)-dependent oxidoreductase [Pseudomonadota bacterium]